MKPENRNWLAGCAVVGAALAVALIVGDRFGPSGQVARVAHVMPTDAQFQECLDKGIQLEHQVALCATDTAYAAAQRYAFERNYAEHVNPSCAKTGAKHGDRAWVDCQRGRSFVTRVKPKDSEACPADSPGIAL